MDPTWLVRLDQTLSSYSILLGLLVGVLAAGLLYKSGFLGWACGVFGLVTRSTIRRGFRIWERWLSWADWRVYLLLTLALLAAGALAASVRPEITLVCAGLTLIMGAVTCLAYMFIDIERYEVERGHKAVHNPLKGQEPAPNVARYGHRVAIPLLLAAAAGAIGGFALLNQGFYETVGRGWYRVDETSQPGFAEFLTYVLIHLLSVIDILDLADSRQLLHGTFVRKAAWPAAAMMAGLRLFFTLILLQQVFASVRQGWVLAETITDFWSPHEPIHDRARNALPQFGAAVIGPLLVSLRGMTALTRAADQLPRSALIGALRRSDLSGTWATPRARPGSRFGALGHRRRRRRAAGRDPSDLVRLSAPTPSGCRRGGPRPAVPPGANAAPPYRGRWGYFRGRWPAEADRDPTGVAVAALSRARDDPRQRVTRRRLGAGAAASDAADTLAALLGIPPRRSLSGS